MVVAGSVTIPVNTIELTPGSVVAIHNVSWAQFESILDSLGEQRRTRIAYYDGILEIMSPLPAHERPNRIIGYIVTVLLDAGDRPWEDFGSTTFRRQKNMAGLEPDTCFYIDDHADQVRECMMSMDLEVYPPPDLAIEADLTSKTRLDAYRGIGVCEVWIYAEGKLTIHVLQDGEYVESETSPTFPNRAVTDLIPEWVAQALQTGSSQLLKTLRRQLTEESDS